MPAKRPVNGAAAAAAASSASPSKPTSTSPPSSSKSASKSAPIAITANSSPQDIILGIWQRYLTQTSQRTKLLDAFMAFLVVVGVVQFVYCVLAGNYPFNAFLSGFSAAVGQFVLTASLRMQTSEQDLKRMSTSKPSSSKGSVVTTDLNCSTEGVSPERAFADYVFGSVILHFFCINFIN